MQKTSLPTRGAWIEIKGKEQTKKANRSLPTRGEWIKITENCGIKPFEKCSGTFRNRFSGIIKSFDTNITNGFTEGCNNKIKVLKRNA